MPISIADVVAKLPKSLVEDVPQDVLSAVVAAERAAQASVVRYDGKRPSRLDQALVARVRYNLEQTAPTTAAEVIRAGGRSTEARELEADYSTRSPRVADEPRPARRARSSRGKRGKKKATKKAAATVSAATPAAGQQADSASKEGK